jgi:uncharacterized protein (UPF0335 family)
MRKRELSQLRRFRRVEGFVMEHARPIVGSRLDRMLAQLRSIIERIERAGADHDSVRRQSLRKTREERSLLADLREDHMLRVSEIASVDADAPKGLARSMRSPHKRTALHRTLAAAHAMVDIAATHADWFVSQGLESGFVRDYRAAIAAVERVERERDRLLRRQIETSAAVQMELQKGKRLVQGLSAVLRRDLKGEPALLATWQKIKRTTD